MRKAAKANNVPVVALTTDKAERRFESMKAAAARIVKGRLGRSLAGAQHTICEVCCGRRETAYGFICRRA